MIKYYNTYTQKLEEHNTYKWYMFNLQSRQHRIFKTGSESRTYYRDIEFVNIRKKRKPFYINAWTYDKTATCMDMKSWKKLYKVRKQYLKPKNEVV